MRVEDSQVFGQRRTIRRVRPKLFQSFFRMESKDTQVSLLELNFRTKLGDGLRMATSC